MKKLLIFFFLVVAHGRSTSQKCAFDSTCFPCANCASSDLNQWSLDGYNTIYWLKQIAHRIGIVNNNIGSTSGCPFDSTYFPYSDPTCTSFTQWSLDGYNTVYWLKQIAYNIKGGGSGKFNTYQPAKQIYFGSVTGDSATSDPNFTYSDGQRSNYSQVTAFNDVSGISSVLAGEGAEQFNVSDNNGIIFLYVAADNSTQISTTNTGISFGVFDSTAAVGNGVYQFKSNLFNIGSIVSNFPRAQGLVRTFLENDGSGNWSWQPISGTNIGCQDKLEGCKDLNPVFTLGGAAGTGATEVDTATNLGGVIYITTGTTPATNNILVTITFNGITFATASSMVITPANAAAASFFSPVWVKNSKTQANILIGTPALSALTTYAWNFVIIGMGN